MDYEMFTNADLLTALKHVVVTCAVSTCRNLNRNMKLKEKMVRRKMMLITQAKEAESLKQRDEKIS